MSNKLLLFIIGLLVANLVVGIVNKPSDSLQSDANADGSIGLVRPWFIDEALASDDRSARAIADISSEAGISAYVKTPAAINLTTARGALTSVIESNSNYLLGTITPTGYDSDFSAQVMVHKTGWIMAWYHKDTLASMIVTTKDMTFSNSTTLSIAIDKVTSALRLTKINSTYYHFKYPTANRMLIARKNYTTGTTMKVSIPATVTDLESSLYADSMTYCGYNIKVLINTVSVMDHYSCNDLDHYIDISTYLNEAVNTIKLDSVSQSPQFAVVIIYQG